MEYHLKGDQQPEKIGTEKQLELIRQNYRKFEGISQPTQGYQYYRRDGSTFYAWEQLDDAQYVRGNLAMRQDDDLMVEINHRVDEVGKLRADQLASKILKDIKPGELVMINGDPSAASIAVDLVEAIQRASGSLIVVRSIKENN